MRTLRRCREQIDIVQLAEGFQIAVPRWMLDPVACQQLPQESKPRVALSALRRVQELVQSRGLSHGRAVALSDTSPLTKGDHVSKANPAVLSNPTPPPQENALGSVPGTDPSAGSSIDGSTSSTSSAPGHGRKDQP